MTGEILKAKGRPRFSLNGYNLPVRSAQASSVRLAAPRTPSFIRPGKRAFVVWRCHAIWP
jgi:hypothetical protein